MARAELDVKFGIRNCADCEYNLRCEECIYNKQSIDSLVNTIRQDTAKKILTHIGDIITDDHQAIKNYTWFKELANAYGVVVYEKEIINE